MSDLNQVSFYIKNRLHIKWTSPQLHHQAQHKSMQPKEPTHGNGQNNSAAAKYKPQGLQQEATEIHKNTEA